MFDLPTQENVEEVIVDQNVVLGQMEPMIVYSDDKKKTGKKSSAA